MKTINASTELARVDFHGDTLIAAKSTDGRIMVSVKAACESLGVDYSRQLQKLKEYERKGYAWAQSGVGIMPTPDKQGRNQRQVMIEAKCLPMWLTTIAPSRVKAALREKLKQFQLEAAEVLALYFGVKPAASMETQEFLLKFREEVMAAVQKQIAEASAEVVQVRSELAEAKDEAVSLQGDLLETERDLQNLVSPFEVDESTPYETLEDFLTIRGVSGRLLGWPIRGSHRRGISKHLSHQCRLLGIPVRTVKRGPGPAINTYPLGVLQAWLNRYELSKRVTPVQFKQLNHIDTVYGDMPR